MISFAAYDPAFESIAESPEFVRVMALAADMELTVQNLAGAVSLISGSGSNVLAHVGSDGVFLVDTGYLPALPALRRTLASISRHPVRRLLITHPHEDHMGSAAAFGTEARVIYLGANPMMFPGTTDPDAFLDRMEAALGAMHPETIVA